MEPRHVMLVCAILAIAFAFIALYLIGTGRTKRGLASIALALVSMAILTITDITDDTPTWDEVVADVYGITIDDYPEREKDQPGNWRIDDEWRTCYSPDFYDVDDFEDITILCQPVAPETEFEELAK